VSAHLLNRVSVIQRGKEKAVSSYYLAINLAEWRFCELHFYGLLSDRLVITKQAMLLALEVQ